MRIIRKLNSSVNNTKSIRSKNGNWSDDKENEFNRWLNEEFGYEDLYSYFSDLVESEWKGKSEESLSKYQRKLLDSASNSILDKAKNFGLDIDEVSWEVVRDIVPFN